MKKIAIVGSGISGLLHIMLARALGAGRMQQRIAYALRAAQADGRLAPDRDPEAVAAFIARRLAACSDAEASRRIPKIEPSR